jgi:hypothetical protein
MRLMIDKVISGVKQRWPRDASSERSDASFDRSNGSSGTSDGTFEASNGASERSVGLSRRWIGTSRRRTADPRRRMPEPRGRRLRSRGRLARWGDRTSHPRDRMSRCERVVCGWEDSLHVLPRSGRRRRAAHRFVGRRRRRAPLAGLFGPHRPAVRDDDRRGRGDLMAVAVGAYTSQDSQPTPSWPQQ